MKVSTLRRVLLSKPFRPLRIKLQSGEAVEIRHPEAVLLTEDWVVIAGDSDLKLITEPTYIVSVQILKNGASPRPQVR